jgi:predicted dehydrogenase
MDQTMNRRTFTTTALSTAALGTLRAADAANNKVRIAVCGLGRGMGHVSALLKCENVEVAYLCELDEGRMSKGVEMVQKISGKAPQTFTDFRKLLEQKDLDAVTFALPNHWHAPATILACAAGKHVYVEKPGSHNANEGELMVQAARKAQRVVMMGNQRRSYPFVREAMQRLREGVIGKVTYGRSSYNNTRKITGAGDQKPGAHVDLDLWQGPAPLRDDVAKYVHYDWHWKWNWGGGELANNGPHGLDLVRWGLGAEYPLTIAYVGGRYHFDDTQETPDSGVVTFDFGKNGAAWDCSSCNPRAHDKPEFVEFYGDGGCLTISGGSGYTIYDMKGKEVEKQSGPASDVLHFQNFIDSILGKAKPNSEIEEGQKSTLLCHLGNIAWRSGRTIHFDPMTKKIVGDDEAVKLYWGREYRPGWEPKV